MTHEKSRSQKAPGDVRKNKENEHYVSQVPRQEKNTSNTYEIMLESRKRPREITNTQNQRFHSPKKTRQDQTSSPNKIINITLGVSPKLCVLKHRETSSPCVENTQPDDELEGELSQVEVKLEMSSRVALMNSELEKRNIQVLKQHIVDEYPSLKAEQEKVTEYTKEESKEKKKKTFRKLTNHSVPSKVHKLLSQFADSVGYMFWDNNGNQGNATCFVFRELFIFTSRHVISDIVCKGSKQGVWADIISQCVRVTFDDEPPARADEDCFLLEPWLEISDGVLDYAVLKLKDNGQQVPVGLYNGIPPVPPHGLMYIIGHPNGNSKSIDGCAMIPQREPGKTDEEHVQAREAVGSSGVMPYICMNTQRSFQKGTSNPDDTTFYTGSFGSPVFDSKGLLVAMLTAGFNCEYEGEVSNIIEFGSTMEDILNDIKKKHEAWYKDVCVNPQDVEMPSLEY